jgi:hypothetical protein
MHFLFIIAHPCKQERERERERDKETERERERERQRERERILLAIKRGLKGSKHNVLSGNTASECTGSIEYGERERERERTV